MRYRWNKQHAKHALNRLLDAANRLTGSFAARMEEEYFPSTLSRLEEGSTLSTGDKELIKILGKLYEAIDATRLLELETGVDHAIWASTSAPADDSGASSIKVLKKGSSTLYIFVTSGSRVPPNSKKVEISLYELRQGYLGASDAADANTGLVATRDSNLTIVRPDAEHLAGLPRGAHPFAVFATVATGNAADRVLEINTSGSRTTVTIQSSGTGVEIPTDAPRVEDLLRSARTAYRAWLGINMGRPAYDAEEAERLRAARQASAERFARYAQREVDTERHVPTLPFVPNGLSSSRRWGIEVESGGARGVPAPDQWNRIGDGSLRSAYDGYVEVQDFEPHDEEVTEFVRPGNCPLNGGRHQYELLSYNTLGNAEFNPNPDYVNPADCEQCGTITRTVRVEPRTIRHHAQSDDCAEFVSPILVSMHSTGLKAITDALSKQPQNASAGVHVHVEASDLTNAEVATLIFGYDILEPILEASYQRENRRYCARRSVDSVLTAARRVRPHTAASITNAEVRGGERYVTLNTQALNAHGTIEFRAMGPVYDYDYLVRWAMLCRELVNIVKAGFTVSQFSRIKTWQDLLNVLATHGKEYIRAAVFEQTGETGHAADLLKREEDVTTEALDADLEVAFNSTPLASWASGLRAASYSGGLTAEQLGNLSSQLVGVRPDVERNGTWAV